MGLLEMEHVALVSEMEHLMPKVDQNRIDRTLLQPYDQNVKNIASIHMPIHDGQQTWKCLVPDIINIDGALCLLTNALHSTHL